MDFLSICNNIYTRIQDEYSKYIFEKRVLYSLTGEERYVKEIVKSIKEYQNMCTYRRAPEGAYIYGAGI